MGDPGHEDHKPGREPMDPGHRAPEQDRKQPVRLTERIKAFLSGGSVAIWQWCRSNFQDTLLPWFLSIAEGAVVSLFAWFLYKQASASQGGWLKLLLSSAYFPVMAVLLIILLLSFYWYRIVHRISFRHLVVHWERIATSIFYALAVVLFLAVLFQSLRVFSPSAFVPSKDYGNAVAQLDQDTSHSRSSPAQPSGPARGESGGTSPTGGIQVGLTNFSVVGVGDPDATKASSDSRETDSTVLQLAGIILAFVAVMLAIGGWVVHRRLQQADRLDAIAEDLRNAASISTDIVVSSLPSFTTTQHISWKTLQVLKRIDDLVTRTPYFREFVDKKEHSWWASRMELARGIYHYGIGDKRCMRLLKSVIDMPVVERETRLTARLWLGLGKRQYKDFDGSRKEFEDLREEAGASPLLRLGARVGAALTLYAKFKYERGARDKKHPPDAVFDREAFSDLPLEGAGDLVSSFREFQDLWEDTVSPREQGWHTFMPLYFARSAADCLRFVERLEAKDANTLCGLLHVTFLPKATGTLVEKTKRGLRQQVKDSAKFVLAEAVLYAPTAPGGDEVPHITVLEDDFGFLANYYLGIAMCLHLIRDVMIEDPKKGERVILKTEVDAALSKALRYANLVETYFPAEATIYSERALREESANAVVQEIKDLSGLA